MAIKSGWQICQPFFFVLHGCVWITQERSSVHYEANDEEPEVSGYMLGMNGRAAPRNNHTMRCHHSPPHPPALHPPLHPLQPSIHDIDYAFV